jgi:hypothetical protein
VYLFSNASERLLSFIRQLIPSLTPAAIICAFIALFTCLSTGNTVNTKPCRRSEMGGKNCIGEIPLTYNHKRQQQWSSKFFIVTTTQTPRGKDIAIEAIPGNDDDVDPVNLVTLYYDYGYGERTINFYINREDRCKTYNADLPFTIGKDKRGTPYRVEGFTKW